MWVFHNTELPAFIRRNFSCLCLIVYLNHCCTGCICTHLEECKVQTFTNIHTYWWNTWISSLKHSVSHSVSECSLLVPHVGSSLLPLHHLCMTQKCACSALIRVCMRVRPDAEAGHLRGFATLRRESGESWWMIFMGFVQCSESFYRFSWCKNGKSDLIKLIAIYIKIYIYTYMLRYIFSFLLFNSFKLNWIQISTLPYFFLTPYVTKMAGSHSGRHPTNQRHKSVTSSVFSNTEWWHSVDNQRWCWLQTANGSTAHVSLIS